jgi:EAL domain-containing protein (putative c-di-GMP-specific phosphodiesterase class I)
MARKLHLTTVAEGIETEFEAQMLRGLECDVGQGYVFSRPAPLKGFLQWLKVEGRALV